MEIVKALQPYSSVSDQEIYKIFNKSQHDMLDVFRSMIVLTKHETDIMGKLPIAFYYLREDYSIPHSFLTNNHINCVSIASGGESILNLSTMEQKEIIAIDMNSNQLNLTKIKMEDKQNSNISDYAGKFEAMFSHIRRRLSSQDIQTIKMATNVSCKEVVDFICQDVFQKKHLITIFGEDAVRFTKKDFGEHFSKVFSSRKQPYSFGDRNIYNILTNSPLKEPRHGDGSNIIYKHVRILDDTFFNDLSFTNKQGIDYIDLSNIGDWMEYYVFKDIIMSAHQKMNKNGILVLRKLLGDYSLKETMETLGFSCHSFKDSTEFYTECIIGIKS